MNKEAQLNEVKDEKDAKIEELSNIIDFQRFEIERLSKANQILMDRLETKDSIIEFIWSKINQK